MTNNRTPEPWSNAGIKEERDALRAQVAELAAALERIADGQVMSGEFSHIETVHEYQRIARTALAKVRP